MVCGHLHQAHNMCEAVRAMVVTVCYFKSLWTIFLFCAHDTKKLSSSHMISHFCPFSTQSVEAKAVIILNQDFENANQNILFNKWCGCSKRDGTALVRGWYSSSKLGGQLVLVQWQLLNYTSYKLQRFQFVQSWSCPVCSKLVMSSSFHIEFHELYWKIVTIRSCSSISKTDSDLDVISCGGG